MMASVHEAHLGTMDEGIKFHIMEDLAEKSSHIDMAEAARDSGLALEMIDVLKRSDFIERPKYSCDIVRRAVQNVPAHNKRLVFARVTELKIRLEEPYLFPTENWARNWAYHIDDDALSDKLEEMVRDIEKRFVGGGQSLKGLESAKQDKTISVRGAGVSEDDKSDGPREGDWEDDKIESGDEERTEREYAESALERPPHISEDEWPDFVRRPEHISPEEWRRCLRDMAFFYRMEDQLVRRGCGDKWVAVYNERVVDSDDDNSALLIRISDKYPGESVYVGLCGIDQHERIKPIHVGPFAWLRDEDSVR